MITHSFGLSSSSRNLRAALCGILAAIVLIAPVALHAQQSATPYPTDSYAGRVPGIVYVQFRTGYVPPNGGRSDNAIGIKSNDPVMKIFKDIGVTSMDLFDPYAWKDSISHRLGIDRMYVVKYSSEAAPLEVVERLLQTTLVQSVSPRYIFKPQVIPNDPLLGSQYYLTNIQAEAAWGVTEGDSNVIIADVDEGVNYHHEDLKGNIKHNPGNDASLGYPNDSVGWNTALNNNNTLPPPCQGCEGEHGTETTGCFGAVANNSAGIAGVAPGCKILPVRISNDEGQLTGAYEGIHYASTYCAKNATHAVINNSWGGTSDADALSFGAIFPQEITARGQICVASAGNYALDNDVTPFYPACVPGVLSVGATDENDLPTSFTHYGHIVSVFAPGIDIITTTLQDPEENDGYTDSPGVAGTSFSGPITAGICALVMSADSTLSPAAVMQRVIQTCDPIPDSAKYSPYLYHGRVNANKALSLPATPALAIQDYSVSSDTLGPLGPFNSTNSLNVDFIDLAGQGTNLLATMLPGLGYTWNGYNPQFQSEWPSANLGMVSPKVIAPGHFNVIRTGEFSQGSISISFLVNDNSGYSDTLHVQVAIDSQAGMVHRLLVQHATCVKQLDAVSGWAGFGYKLPYFNPETNSEDTVLISQFSRRSDTGWSVPSDLTGYEDAPVTTMDAIDANTAWFGATEYGTNLVLMTADGGDTWQSAAPGTPVMSIHFADANNGKIVGVSGGKCQIFTTNDGGSDWTASSALSAKAGELSFNNASAWNGTYAWIGTNQGEVYYTTDNNKWVAVALQNASAKQKIAMAVGFSPDNTTGYCCVHGQTNSVDSAGLFYSQTHGASWSSYGHAPAGFIPYGVSFIPGTTKAVITSNQGVFTLASPTDTLVYFAAPSSWDPSSSEVSSAGTSSNYTISAVSAASGIVDATVGAPSGVQDMASSTNSLKFDVSPNPFSNSTMLYFSLPTDEHVRIRVTDVLGRAVSEVYDGLLQAGPRSLEINLGDAMPGVYHCSIETENGEIGEKSIVFIR